MITVKGFRYYSDYRMPKVERNFNTLDEFEKWIENNSVGKNRIHLPPQLNDGSFDQQWAGSFSGHLSFTDETRSQDSDISCHICLVERDGAIIFSSGDYTERKGHISLEMKSCLAHLKTYINSDYNFAP